MIIELLFLFCARTIDMSLATLRQVFVIQGRKYSAAAVGFVEIFVYTLALGLVVSAADDPLKLFVFSAGFSAGIICGVTIEEYLALGHRALQVVVDVEDRALVEDLRMLGQPVTVWNADGRDGGKVVINVLVGRRQAFSLARQIRDRHPGAFVLLSEPKAFLGGKVEGKLPRFLTEALPATVRESVPVGDLLQKEAAASDGGDAGVRPGEPIHVPEPETAPARLQQQMATSPACGG